VDAAHPTRLSSAVFAAKALGLRLRRALGDAAAPAPRLSREGATFSEVAGAAQSPLWSDETLAERAMQLGKVQNLRVAARALDGLVIPAGAVFSFWRNVGPPIAARGYVPGRMLQQGCMVASVGGGLCQLSNALYEVALQAGCRIVERHAHSRIVPGSLAAEGRDATVAWNYVDLRFTAERALRLSVRLDRDTLSVRLLAENAAKASAPALEATGPSLVLARSCASCGESDCFMHEHAGVAPPEGAGRHVFLVDEAWPEFKSYVQEAAAPADRLGLPLDGAPLGLTRYAWPTAGFGRISSAPVEALRRSWALRRAGAQGANRRNAELAAAERIAASLSKSLTPDIVSVTVAQSYLPFLWRDGVLGGRDVTVLMTRLPMTVLQDRLDAAARAQPHATLGDFRAPAWLVAAEAEALADAVRIVTPHAEIAALFGARAVRLRWHTSPARARPATPLRRIGFPGPTVARKGAHAVREAALALNLEVMPLGAELEGEGFWRGVRLAPAGDWTTADVVVQPALVEDQPRRLLAALAAGIPVIATPACGLDPQPGLKLIPPGDPEALIAALASMMASQTAPTGSDPRRAVETG
jgi:hypothetical protein